MRIRIRERLVPGVGGMELLRVVGLDEVVIVPGARTDPIAVPQVLGVQRVVDKTPTKVR